MNSSAKISLYWLLIAFGLVIQSNIELMEKVFFATNSTNTNSQGIPVAVHVLFILTLILPVVFSFLTSLISNKIFKWVSIIYAVFLCILNVYHFIADGVSDINNLSKILVLLLVPIVNVFLIIELFKQKPVVNRVDKE